MILTFGNEPEVLGSSLLGIKVLQWCRVMGQAHITKCLAVRVICFQTKKFDLAAELDHHYQ